MGYLVDFWLQTKTVVFDLSAADERMFVPSDFVCVANGEKRKRFHMQFNDLLLFSSFFTRSHIVFLL